MSPSTLVFFQVVCDQVPCPIQQCVHFFLSFPFVADIPVWKPFLLTFMSLARLNFRGTSAFLALSLHTNTVCPYFCVTWHQFHLLYAFFLYWILSGALCSFLQASSHLCLASCTWGCTILETGRCGLGKSTSSLSPLFFSPAPYPTLSFQAHPEQAQVCSPEGQGCDPAFCLVPSFEDPDLHHLIFTAAKAAAPNHHTPRKFFLVCKNQDQQSTSPSLTSWSPLLGSCHLWTQKPPGLLLPSYIVPPADKQVVEVLHWDLGYHTFIAFLTSRWWFYQGVTVLCSMRSHC